MKRSLFLATALALSTALVACSDDNGDPDDATVDNIQLPDAGVDTVGEGTGPTCSHPENIGKKCGEGTEEEDCGEGMTCLTGGPNGGVCTCTCTPNDPSEPFSEVDSCPDTTTNICIPYDIVVPEEDGGGTREENFCMRKCKPKLGANDCEQGVFCNVRANFRAGFLNGDWGTGLCDTVNGCQSNADCPVLDVDGATCDPEQNDDETGINPACSGQICFEWPDGGHCGLPGNCDTTSGICGLRTEAGTFTEGAQIGDPCDDDTDCAANQDCFIEVDKTERAAGGASCTEDSDCCSDRCEEGTCEPGLCVVSRRNGYCVVTKCAFQGPDSLPEFGCPQGEAFCNYRYTTGICMKACNIDGASDCRGRDDIDKWGDYECRGWDALGYTTMGGVSLPLADGPICDFGDDASCDGFANNDFGCEILGLENNPTHMQCQDAKDSPTGDQKTALGFCYDDTASGPE